MERTVKEFSSLGLPKVSLVQWSNNAYEVHIPKEAWEEISSNIPESTNQIVVFLKRNINKFFELHERKIKVLPLEDYIYKKYFQSED